MRLALALGTLALVVAAVVGCATSGHHCSEMCCPKCCPVMASGAAPAPVVEGRTMAGWAEAAKPQDGETRLAAVNALAEIGPASYCYAAEMLESEDSSLRYTGIETLRLIGPPALPAAPRLGSTLGDRDPLLRANAARALDAIGKGAAAEVPALVGALDDEKWYVRYYAAKALGTMGWHAWGYCEDLNRLARHDLNFDVRTMAAESSAKVTEDYLAHCKRFRR